LRPSDIQHLNLEVSPPRVAIFRDATVDLLAMEQSAQMSGSAKEGLCTFLNYVGGSYIDKGTKVAEHLKILNSSWVITT